MPRGSGKTYQLIKNSSYSWYTIVCHSSIECDRILIEAKSMKLKIPPPITYDEFISKRYVGKHIFGFLIDNADSLLQYMTPLAIEAISLCP